MRAGSQSGRGGFRGGSNSDPASQDGSIPRESKQEEFEAMDMSKLDSIKAKINTGLAGADGSRNKRLIKK